MSLTEQVVGQNDTLEQLAVAFEVIQGVSTVVIAVVSFVWSRHSRRTQRVEAMRTLLRDACSEVLLEFALDFFGNRRFVDSADTVHELSEGDFQQILSTSILFPPTGWHRACRSRVILFLESLRPCTHVLGDGSADFALQGPVDPIVSRLRLALKALADYWSPQVRPDARWDGRPPPSARAVAAVPQRRHARAARRHRAGSTHRAPTSTASSSGPRWARAAPMNGSCSDAPLLGLASSTG